MTADLPKIKWSESQAELRSRLSSLSWFARLDEYDQLFILQLWEKAAPSGVLTKEAIGGDYNRFLLLFDLIELRFGGPVAMQVRQVNQTVLLAFGDKFFFTDYIVVTYGTLTLSDPKHYQVFCQLTEHDLDVATMLRYVPMQR